LLIDNFLFIDLLAIIVKDDLGNHMDKQKMKKANISAKSEYEHIQFAKAQLYTQFHFLILFQ